MTTRGLSLMIAVIVPGPLAFGEPEAPLTLESAMDIAETHSFSLRIAGKEVEAARDRKRQTTGTLFPSLSVTGQSVWNDPKTNDLVGLMNGPQQLIPKVTRTGALTVAQPITGFGALLLKVQADALAVDGAAEGAEAARLGARIGGAQAFLAAQKAAQFLEIAKTNLEAVRHQRADGSALRDAGRLTEADSMRLELGVAEAQSQLIQAQAAFDVARAALAEATGKEAASVTLAPAGESQWERSQQKPLGGSPPAFQVNAVAEVRRARTQVGIARFYQAASLVDYAPSLNFFASYSRNFLATDLVITSPINPSQVLEVFPADKNRDLFTFGLNLDWKVWDWGARKARFQEMTANQEQARLGLEATESAARLEERQAVSLLEAAREALDAAKSQVRFAEQAHSLTTSRFQVGEATTTDLMVSTRDLTGALGQLANVRGNLDLSWLRLQKSRGQRPSVLHPS